VAVDAAAGTQIGEAFDTYWRGVRWFTLLAFALTAALIIFSAVVEYSPVYRVPLYTDTRSGIVRLTAPVTGHIVRLAVADGTEVEEGALLAILSSDKLSADGSSQRAALDQKLRVEKQIIEREVAAANQEATANRAMIEKRLAGLRAERESLQIDLKAAEQLLASLRQQSERFASLVSNGYVTPLQLAQKQDEVTLQQSRVAAARGALTRVDRDIETSEAEQRLVDARLAGLVENRRREAGELDRLSVQTDADAEQVIRAPFRGTVSTALVSVGQSILSGQVLFTIAPIGQPLIARLMLPARAAASVHPDMEVKLTLRAYPREKFGQFPARIVSLSDTPTLPGDDTQILPVAEPSFVANAMLPPELHGPRGETLWMRPGMLGEALVPIERRTVLEWLLEPILRGFNGDAELVGRGSTVALSAGVHSLDAEIANTYASRARGLMYRRSLEADHGMLFVYPDLGRHCMWMKNTLAPLSVAFIDDTGTILNIADMAPQTQELHCSNGASRYALEMRRGWFAAKGIVAGESVTPLKEVPAAR
jgi:membrane fusion protein